MNYVKLFLELAAFFDDNLIFLWPGMNLEHVWITYIGVYVGYSNAYRKKSICVLL